MKNKYLLNLTQIPQYQNNQANCAYWIQFCVNGKLRVEMEAQNINALRKNIKLAQQSAEMYGNFIVGFVNGIKIL